MSRRRVLTEEMVSMRTKSTRMDLIKNLNLWGNDLEDISVLQCMPNLEVLSLSVNCVNSLADLKHCLKLSELYLRKNHICDLAEVLNLRHLRQMRVLWLSDNPCAALPHYRQYVLHHLPGLTKFDSLEVTEEERRQACEADLDSVQTRVVSDFPTVHDDNASPDMLDLRRSQPPELPADVLYHSISGISEDDRGDASKSSANSREVKSRRSASSVLDPEPSDTMFNGRASLDGARSYGGIESSSERGTPAAYGGRPMRSNSGNEFMDQTPPDRFHGGAVPSRSGEFARADFAPASRSSQARPVPASPSASPQWQAARQQRHSGSAGSPLGAGELGTRSGDQAWSHEYAHERAFARGDPRGGPAPRSTGGAAASRSFVQGHGESPPDSQLSEEALGTPNQATSPTDNILCAVLALIKELDTQGLELVRRAVEQRQDDAP